LRYINFILLKYLKALHFQLKKTCPETGLFQLTPISQKCHPLRIFLNKIKNQFISAHVNYNARSLATLLFFSDYLTLIAHWMPWKPQMWLNHLALYYTF